MNPNAGGPMTSHVIVQDPGNLSSRFSDRHRLGFDPDFDIEEMIDKNLAPDDESDLLSEGQGLNFSSVEKYLHRIPPREADLIEKYYCYKMKQEQIARIFRITQAAVSYRLHRGIRRIQFLRTIPELERDEFELDLGPKFITQDLEILWLMYETTCQSKIAKILGLTQGRVRHRFFRALDKIKKMIEEEVRERRTRFDILKRQGADEDELREAFGDLSNEILSSRYGKYYTVFFAISDKHFNILHEVSLPQFLDRSEAQILTIE